MCTAVLHLRTTYSYKFVFLTRCSLFFSELSYCFGYQMAPSAGKSPPGTQIGPPKMSTEINVGPNSQPKVSASVICVNMFTQLIIIIMTDSVEKKM